MWVIFISLFFQDLNINFHLISISLKIDLLRHSQCSFFFFQTNRPTKHYLFFIIYNFSQLDFREEKNKNTFSTTKHGKIATHRKSFQLRMFFFKCFFIDKKKNTKKGCQDLGGKWKAKISYIFYSISFRFIFW